MSVIAVTKTWLSEQFTNNEILPVGYNIKEKIDSHVVVVF